MEENITTSNITTVQAKGNRGVCSNLVLCFFARVGPSY